MASNLDRDELFARLTEGIGSLTTFNKWQDYLDAQSKFNNYSPRNAILILEQDPYATRVASYKAWESLGRQVRKGETSLRVLAPLRYTLTDKETQEKSLQIRGWKMVPVFDVAQTDGDPIPEVASRLMGKEPDQLFDKLKGVAEELGFSVQLTTFEDERGGDCNHNTKKIRILETSEPAQRAKTLAHELGHAILHGPEVKGISQGKRELEAESVAYIVGQSFGLESGDYSFGYVAGWAGDPEKAQALILESADRIHKASDTIAKRVDALTAPEVTEPVVEVVRAVDVKSLATAEAAHAERATVVDEHVIVVPVGFDSPPAAAPASGFFPTYELVSGNSGPEWNHE